MHGGTEIDIRCVKYMAEHLAKEFVRTTNSDALAHSLQTDDEGDHHHGAYAEIVTDFDADRDAHFVEIRFCMEVEDLHNVQDWCAAEGFEIVESLFGTRA